MAIIRFLIHITGIDYGLPYGHWSWYNFYSGIGGSFVMSMLAVTTVYYLHHTCQSSWRCLRWGKYPAADGKFRLCAKHHPDDVSGTSRLEMIHLIHRKMAASEQS